MKLTWLQISSEGYPTAIQDLNGDFIIQTTQGSENGDIEADYSWVHFSLSTRTVKRPRNFCLRKIQQL